MICGTNDNTASKPVNKPSQINEQYQLLATPAASKPLRTKSINEPVAQPNQFCKKTPMEGIPSRGNNSPVASSNSAPIPVKKLIQPS